MKCNKCNNKPPAGERVPGHRFGDLVCPKVQDGTIMCNPKWKDHVKKFPRVKIYDSSKVRKKESSSSGKGSSAPAKLKGKGMSRGPDGKFHINMIQNVGSSSSGAPVEEWLAAAGPLGQEELDKLIKAEAFLPPVSDSL